MVQDSQVGGSRIPKILYGNSLSQKKGVGVKHTPRSQEQFLCNQFGNRQRTHCRVGKFEKADSELSSRGLPTAG